MTKPAIHEEIILLLLSTKEIFQSFSEKDLKSIAGREVPPETKADKQVANYLALGLSKIVPEHNIIVEDGEPIIGNSGEPTWVIDPIDGTIPFMYHIPSYMVSVYALKNDVIQAAFAYNPNNGDVFYTDGKLSYCNDVEMKVSTKDSLVEARIALSVNAIETLPNLFSSLRKEGAYIILQEGLVFRSLLVANGYIDATIQIGLKQFESGAVHSLVTNAGGQVRSCTQDNIEFLSTSPNVVITNGNLNRKIASILKGIVERNS